ncbi:MAG: hypothetical protein V4689_12915 [Verrucomicrobiota bacterium]
MTLDELRALAAELFPIAVKNAVDSPTQTNPELIRLQEACRVHYKRLGFNCMFSCFEDVIPKVEGELTLSAWSSKQMSVLPWTFRVNCRPFYLATYCAHFEIDHDGPLPTVTETGYRSIFAPMATFSKISPEQFIRSEVCKDLPKSAQMDLF